jgi:outer membrane protein
MRSSHILSLALVSALAIAPSAFAQDSASGKRFSVVGGGALLKPASNPIDGIKVDGAAAPTLSFSWNVHDNIAIELWGAANKFSHRVRATGEGKIGNVKQQPIALSAQYHFGDADNLFRPFVGVGYYQSNLSSAYLAGPYNNDRVGFKTAKGAINTIGLDLNISPSWFARVDARYSHARSDIRVNGQNSGQKLKLDPWTVGFGIGVRF